MNFVLYGNGSAGNHGCEAIVRGTIALLGEEKNKYTIMSDKMTEDCRYDIQNYAEVKEARLPIARNLKFLIAYFRMKLFKNYTAIDGLYYLEQIEAVKKNDIALSVGGDNYCYGGTEIYYYLNRAYHKVGMKTVLWGCSVEPDVVMEQNVGKDLALYNLIVARESITYEAIRKVNLNTILIPDPAFYMEPHACSLDNRFSSGNVIGINVSPMIVSNENIKGITLENYRELIRYILNETDSYIALIPHVVWENNDDRSILKQLYQEFEQNERLILIEDHPAHELKYIISKCRMFIGARTHATIAAYSSGIPTLVVGYSVKARGIAKDLFGTEEHYVLSVQALKKKDELKNAYIWLQFHEDEIRGHLKNKLTEYMAGGINALKAITDLYES